MEWTTKMEGGGTLYLRDDGNYMYLEANRGAEPKGLYQVVLQGLQGGQVLGTMLPCETGLKLCRMVSRSTMGQWGCLPLIKVICQPSFLSPLPEQGAGNIEEAREFARELASKVASDVAEEEEIQVTKEEETLETIALETGETREEAREKTWKETPFPQEERKMKAEEVSWELVEDIVPEMTEGFRACENPGQWVKDEGLLLSLQRCSKILYQEKKQGVELLIPYDLSEEFPLIPLFCLSSLYIDQDRKYLSFFFGADGKPMRPPGEKR